MKKTTSLLILSCFIVAGIFILTHASPAAAKEPVKIIYDTDMGNDIDDVFALTMLNNLEKRGEVELLAVTVTKDNQYAAPYCKLINTFFQNSCVPIGKVVESGISTDDGRFIRQTLEAKAEDGAPMFPFFNYDEDVTEYVDATKLLRQTLAEQPDASVVIAQVGFSTNLARLLDSPADEISPLTGKELVAQKVKYLCAMAGNFVDRILEFNVITDVESARKVFAEWPTEIYCSGFEIGLVIHLPCESILNDYDYVQYHPVKEAFRLYIGLNPQAAACTFDLTTILFAARQDRGYFDLSEPGKIVVDDEGFTVFTPQPDGNARYFKVNEEQKIRIAEAFQWLCSERLINYQCQ